MLQEKSVKKRVRNLQKLVCWEKVKPAEVRILKKVQEVEMRMAQTHTGTKSKSWSYHEIKRWKYMALKNRTAADEVNNARTSAAGKLRTSQDDAAKASNPKMQQGKTADGRKTGIVRRK